MGLLAHPRVRALVAALLFSRGAQETGVMEREEDVLEVRHLSIRFGSIGVLGDLTFHVPAGTTLAILGPNGAGKTVLFKALIGAIAHDGDIEWKARDRTADCERRDRSLLGEPCAPTSPSWNRHACIGETGPACQTSTG